MSSPGTENRYSPGPTLSMRNEPSGSTGVDAAGAPNLMAVGCSDTENGRSRETSPSNTARPRIETGGTLTSTTSSTSLFLTSTDATAEGAAGGRAPTEPADIGGAPITCA